MAVSHEEPHLLRDFAIIMAVAGAALVLCRQIKLPPVLGYLVAGVLIGPSVLKSVENPETIGLLADLGLVLLLFGIGLECGWRRIREVGGRVIFIAAVEMATMFALGFEIANLLGWSDIDAVFLGSAMCISSSAILMTMLRESGQLLEIRGRLIVGILVVEDFAAVVLLTVLTGVATTGGTDMGGIGVIVVNLTAFAVLALVLGASFANKLVHFVDRFKSEETLLITGLTLCFGLALTAQQLGMSGAAGAFLIGAVLGDSHHAEELERIVGSIRTMFAAIFFVSIGMLIDLALVDDFIVPTAGGFGGARGRESHLRHRGHVPVGTGRAGVIERGAGYASDRRVLIGHRQDGGGLRGGGSVHVPGDHRRNRDNRSDIPAAISFRGPGHQFPGAPVSTTVEALLP